jgi:hypothetical protein
MKKSFIRSSLLFLLSLVVIVNISIVAMAASEKRVDLQNNKALLEVKLIGADSM